MVMVWTPAPMSIDRRSSRGAPEPAQPVDRRREPALAAGQQPGGRVGPNTAAAAALA